MRYTSYELLSIVDHGARSNRFRDKVPLTADESQLHSCVAQRPSATRRVCRGARGKPPQGHGELLSGAQVTHDLPHPPLPPLCKPNNCEPAAEAPPRLGRPPVAIRIIPLVVVRVRCSHLRAWRLHRKPPSERRTLQ
ncbi:hypothetical protein MRX96_054873 [Rhipicephalus microplus]